MMLQLHCFHWNFADICVVADDVRKFDLEIFYDQLYELKLICYAVIFNGTRMND